MKKTVKVLCLTAMLIGVGSAAQAQFRQSVYLNGNIPTGDFASDASTVSDGTIAALVGNGVPLTYEQVGKDASVGFGLGYRASYRFDVGVGMVAPFANVDFLWNTISGKWRDKYSDAYYSTPTYFNIPFLAGVTYIYDELPWDDISAYGEFGIGTDLLWITSEGKGDGNEYFGYKADFAFAWMLGAGAYFGEHFSAGLYYYSFGTHNIDYTQYTLDNNTLAAAQANLHGRERRSAGSVMIRLGFHF
ncbi:MAG: outer membrane beta-barrel protein [Bacteroidales bacterium]|nr:outer membrane beta-barrel protein [Bacteroidales bacterium]MBQ6955812.1 outer membrane beta-barrel protein [Bacteroidales bacterium]